MTLEIAVLTSLDHVSSRTQSSRPRLTDRTGGGEETDPSFRAAYDNKTRSRKIKEKVEGVWKKKKIILSSFSRLLIQAPALLNGGTRRRCRIDLRASVSELFIY